METLEVKKPKARKKTRTPRDPDYAAAWQACRKTYSSRGFFMPFMPSPADCIYVADLRSCLDVVIKSGWCVAAIKAYAFCNCRMYAHHDHVTATAWRAAVYRISVGDTHGAEAFLQRFNADPDHYAFVK